MLAVSLVVFQIVSLMFLRTVCTLSEKLTLKTDIEAHVLFCQGPVPSGHRLVTFTTIDRQLDYWISYVVAAEPPYLQCSHCPFLLFVSQLPLSCSVLYCM